MRLLGIILTVFGLMVAVTTTAYAGNADQPIVGDLNGDGRADVVKLGPSGSSNICTLTVEYRKPDGTLKPPVSKTYKSPLTSQPFCPNMGVAVDLGGDGVTELVLTHFISFNGDLLVLRHFKVVATYKGLAFPSTIRTADFDGDGLVDIWESTDEVQKLLTLRNTPASTIVPGAINVCSSRSIPNYALADFNGDGGQDFLLARDCDFQALREATVLFGTGGAVVLASNTDGSAVYEVYASDFNRDGIPDAGVIVHSGGTTTVRHFVNNGSGVFTEAFTADPAPKIDHEPLDAARHVLR